MLSVTEVNGTSGGGEITLILGETEDQKVRTSPDSVFLVRIWRPHPRRWWEADSPTRSSLPVLRELVGLTMHISAQVDSRLAGAGLLVVPQSAQRALNIAAGLDENSDADPFTEALMEAMIKPISDRANASALVPLVVTVPDDVCDHFNYLTFAKPLDTEARNLRDEAIRRLALGQDAPPELLLGTAGMNHWGAWLVREDVVTTHLEPPLALICDAVTTQFLWPVLADAGRDPADYEQYVIWYSVDHMVMRPNHSQDALELNSRGLLSDEATRAATGFTESDAPDTASLDLATRLALEACHATPSLYAAPGLPTMVTEIRAVLSGTAAPPREQGAPSALPPAEGAPPSTAPSTPTAAPEELPSGEVPATSEAPAPVSGSADAVQWSDWSDARDLDPAGV
jgi:hypothetical protein